MVVFIPTWVTLVGGLRIAHLMIITFMHGDNDNDDDGNDGKNDRSDDNLKKAWRHSPLLA